MAFEFGSRREARSGLLSTISKARIARACRIALNDLTIAFEHRVLGKRYLERRVNDYRLALDATDRGISRRLWRYGTREPEQKFLLERVLRPGMRVFDVGANIGYYTVMMARLVGPQGRIYAVEPHPDNYRLLCHNVSRNAVDNVETENVAIDVRAGKRELFVSDRCNWHSFHDPRITAGEVWTEVYRRHMPTTTSVETRSLAGYLETKPQLDLVRMDLEGFEVEILDALAELPRSQTRTLRVLFETHPEFYHPVQHDMRRVLRRLHERHGYRASYIVSDFFDGSRGSAYTEPGRDVFARYGYGLSHVLDPSHGRPIFVGVRMEDAIDLICTSENVHAVVLEPGG